MVLNLTLHGFVICFFRSAPMSYNGNESSALIDELQLQQQSSSFVVHPADLSMPPAWQGRSVAGPKLRLVNMAAFVEFAVPPADMLTANAVSSSVHVHFQQGRTGPPGNLALAR